MPDEDSQDVLDTSAARGEDELQQLYGRVDTEASRLWALHGERLVCRRGCSMCCVDDITVVAVEAENIRSHHAQLLRDGTPHEVGMCAFLDAEGACRIYPQRPYVCRSQGAPLRWTDHDEEGNIVELRDICSLNEAGKPIEELPAAACWSIGWAEGALAQLQSRLDGRDELSFDGDEDDEPDTAPGRVALRDLFEKRTPESSS
ncbi:MAG: YkgJ family cysteine cluster protein [Candidatus Latescibacterota bacterium]